MKDAIVIGAGAVGVNTALFLAKLGYDVQIIEASMDILLGSARTSFINHSDGFEYYKPGHQRTGEYCIDGSLVKGLIFPLSLLTTNVCDRENPIRFMLSKGSVSDSSITLASFVKNAEYMREYFAQQFESVRKARGWSAEYAEWVFLRRPDSFSWELKSNEYSDISDVVGGCAGSSFGINMPHYYAILKAGLRELEVDCQFNSPVERIENAGDGCLVFAGGRRFCSKQVLLTSGHHIPALTATISGTSPPVTGAYYLNSITFLRLPASDDSRILRAARRINFTLQQEHGCMLACIVPPSFQKDGLAVTYYPSERGSQLRKHLFDANQPVPPPGDWDRVIGEGLPAEHPNVRATMSQACHYYPFLREYAKVERTLCRSVFNAATPESLRGTDRRVREIPTVTSILSANGRISSWAPPKWTNAELVALMATDHVSTQLRGHRLPKHGKTRFGPTGLDVAEISKTIEFNDIAMDPTDTAHYAQLQGIDQAYV